MSSTHAVVERVVRGASMLRLKVHPPSSTTPLASRVTTCSAQSRLSTVDCQGRLKVSSSVPPDSAAWEMTRSTPMTMRISSLECAPVIVSARTSETPSL